MPSRRGGGKRSVDDPTADAGIAAAQHTVRHVRPFPWVHLSYKLAAGFEPSPLIGKIMQVFVSMDGKDFKAGLANLKAAAEK
jgi:hypothetical protein